MEKRRYALRLAYDGGAFRGYQSQPGAPTVQGALMKAFAHMGLSPTLEPAARTDAGVHAVAQLVTFTARAELEVDRLRREVNAHTPQALVCLDAFRVPAHFHARASAWSRLYVYLVGWPASPELSRYAWTLPDPRAFPDLPAPRVDVERLRDALAGVVGEHDFAPFARTGDQTARRRTDPRATVRELLRAEVVSAEGLPLVAILLEGRGFLRAMARHIVGAAVSASVGASEPGHVARLLASPNEKYRGPRAPGWGLTLARVTYREPGLGEDLAQAGRHRGQ